MTRRDPDLAIRFRRAIERDGAWAEAQKMRAAERPSYLRGLYQVWFAVHGRKAGKS